MNRRRFLSLLGGAAAAMTLDPERALWVPGKKLISIPKPLCTDWSPYANGWAAGRLVIGDVITIAGQYTCNPTTGKLQEFRVSAVAESEIRLDPVWAGNT